MGDLDASTRMAIQRIANDARQPFGKFALL